MNYSIHRALELPPHRLKRYGPHILKALEKLAAKYRDDISLNKIAQEIISGERELWLILRGQQFSAFVTTRLEHTLSGKKRLMILELAGQGGPNLVPLLKQLEQYGQKCGASEICPIGRRGWSKALRALGYSCDLIKYKKLLSKNNRPL